MDDKQKKTARLNLRFPEDVRLMLEDLARADARTPTSWLEFTIRQEHAKLKRRKPKE